MAKPTHTNKSVKKTGTKIGKLIALLRRKQGATLDQMTRATGWQKHSVRAALTGLRKKGHPIERSTSDGVSTYRVIKAGQ